MIGHFSIRKHHCRIKLYLTNKKYLLSVLLFSIQNHTDTKARQLKQWNDVILHYCKSMKVYEIGVN